MDGYFYYDTKSEMVSQEIDKNAFNLQKSILCFISCVLFYIIYNFCGWYASQSGKTISFVLDFEHQIPFISWLVIPYMTSGILFISIFFFCTSQQELFLLTKRINFITIISGVIFLLLPLHHTFTKPSIHSSLLNFFFQFINNFDNNYNQAPSLHISYAFVFWSVLRLHLKGLFKSLAFVWLSLMSIATLAIFQHHVIDIVSSILLVNITSLIFPRLKSRNYKIALVYFIMSSIFLFVATIIWNYSKISATIFIWISLTLVLVGIAYYKSNPRFLKNEVGNISLYKKIIHLPYIACYRVIFFFNVSIQPTNISCILPSIFIGPKLTKKQYCKLGYDTNKTYIIDLMAESEENKWIRCNTNYYSYPLLDIGSAKKIDINNIIELIFNIHKNIKQDEKIYIHCTMGRSRCTAIAILLLIMKLNISKEKAIKQIENIHPNSRINKYLTEII